ncbi:ubiquinol-cytochrome c reductase complex assembly factor 6 [Hetaerina americana]|uniref:ubiquinol-cytochrome c reductase complex assembly factor 6 n=1 Tax=Hetaerina americana TaxID=62018 RepID=UPI003A7F4463
MPAGTTWPNYLKFFTAAMISMFAGSQVVHIYYKPLNDMDELVQKEMLNLRRGLK